MFLCTYTPQPMLLRMSHEPPSKVYSKKAFNLKMPQQRCLVDNTFVSGCICTLLLYGSWARLQRPYWMDG